MITPSWLTPISKNLGDPAHGKLKADQWRVLGATYLPASLVRMWSTPGQGNGTSLKRRREVLHVTMLLLSAVNIASSRVSSEMNADRYLSLIISYIEGVRGLFPEYEFRPNQHMAIHLHEYLRSFGPVHSWWTFPFERMIGMLQRIPTNCKDGAGFFLCYPSSFLANFGFQASWRRPFPSHSIDLPICEHLSQR